MWNTHLILHVVFLLLAGVGTCVNSLWKTIKYWSATNLKRVHQVFKKNNGDNAVRILKSNHTMSYVNLLTGLFADCCKIPFRVYLVSYIQFQLSYFATWCFNCQLLLQIKARDSDKGRSRVKHNICGESKAKNSQIGLQWYKYLQWLSYIIHPNVWWLVVHRP